MVLPSPGGPRCGNRVPRLSTRPRMALTNGPTLPAAPGDRRTRHPDYAERSSPRRSIVPDTIIDYQDTSVEVHRVVVGPMDNNGN